MINKQKLFSFFEKINYNFEDKVDGKNYRYFHAMRVLTLAQKIAKEEQLSAKIDVDLLWVLALFHDIGHNVKLMSQEQSDSNDKTSDVHNADLFEKYIYPLINNDDLKTQLTKVIADFSQKEYKYLESRIVKDADDLDEIGILNVWRLGVYAGKHHLDPQESIDYFYQHDLANKQTKVDKLFFQASQQIAEKRMSEMEGILADFRELNEKII